MIDGVIVKPLVVHKDIPDTPQKVSQKGILVEILRADDGLLKKFGQSVFTVSPRGAIKGFHWHKKQDDLWFMATGRARIVLYDRREDSPTFGKKQALYAGRDDYKLILIPAGVAHGFQVLSKEPVMLFYHVTEMYDTKNPDEERIPYNAPEIGEEWSKM